MRPYCLDDAKLFAVGVEFVDEFGGDFHLAAVELTDDFVHGLFVLASLLLPSYYPF